MDFPETIKNPKTFTESITPWYDGLFDWSWTIGCFGDSITPMDIDAIVERKGHFLVFESKRVGTRVPQGQMILLDKLLGLGKFTVIIVYGKESPERFTIIYPNGIKEDHIGKEAIIERTKSWFNYANLTQVDK